MPATAEKTNVQMTENKQVIKEVTMQWKISNKLLF